MSAARRFLEFGPSTVVVKLGASDCLVAVKKEIFETPSFEVNVVDATGAGDAFEAAFLSAILECGSAEMR
jgi:sugar/nucleoside kinase (ribokinase family)